MHQLIEWVKGEIDLPLCVCVCVDLQRTGCILFVKQCINFSVWTKKKERYGDIISLK